MFVLQSKYDALETDYKKVLKNLEAHQRKLIEVSSKLDRLSNSWGKLVDEINSKGGQSFLDEAVMPNEIQGLSPDMIKKMLQLCHPDKHQGKQLAVEVTQVLIKLKGKK